MRRPNAAAQASAGCGRLRRRRAGALLDTLLALESFLASVRADRACAGQPPNRGAGRRTRTCSSVPWRWRATSLQSVAMASAGRMDTLSSPRRAARPRGGTVRTLLAGLAAIALTLPAILAVLADLTSVPLRHWFVASVPVHGVRQHGLLALLGLVYLCVAAEGVFRLANRRFGAVVLATAVLAWATTVVQLPQALTVHDGWVRVLVAVGAAYPLAKLLILDRFASIAANRRLRWLEDGGRLLPSQESTLAQLRRAVEHNTRSRGARLIALQGRWGEGK